MNAELKTEIVDGVGVISLNRPHRHNAITDELFYAIRTAVREHIDNAEVRCILLRGEGPSFCSGRDTSQLGLRANGTDDFTFVREHQQAAVSRSHCRPTSGSSPRTLCSGCRRSLWAWSRTPGAPRCFRH